MASEMVYPLLPLFLTQVLGAGAMSLGVIEGAAEARQQRPEDRCPVGWPIAGARQKKLVLAGYGIASLVRPLIGLATAWPQVLAIRFSDRLGKGIRSAPRDAMLADFAPATRAAASSAFTAPWITPAPSPARCSRPPFSTSIPATTARSSS